MFVSVCGFFFVFVINWLCDVYKIQKCKAHISHFSWKKSENLDSYLWQHSAGDNGWVLPFFRVGLQLIRCIQAHSLIQLTIWPCRYCSLHIQLSNFNKWQFCLYLDNALYVFFSKLNIHGSLFLSVPDDASQDFSSSSPPFLDTILSPVAPRI